MRLRLNVMQEGKVDMGWISSFEAPLVSYLDQLGSIYTDDLGGLNLLFLSTC